MIRESAEFSKKELMMVASSQYYESYKDFNNRRHQKVPSVNDGLQIFRQKVDQNIYKRTIKSCMKAQKVGFHDWRLGRSQSSLKNSLSKILK
jgi:hypothetical protein